MQVPFWQGSAQIGIEQSPPSQPAVHSQLFGAVQVPPFWQGISQIGIEQSEPSQPASQMHEPDSQMPWPEHSLIQPERSGEGPSAVAAMESGPCVGL